MQAFSDPRLVEKPLVPRLQRFIPLFQADSRNPWVFHHELRAD
jgi:hypothetical protein